MAGSIANGHACQDAIRSALIEDIVDALLSFRRDGRREALEEAERAANRVIDDIRCYGTNTGPAELVRNAIRKLAEDAR